MLKVLRTDGDKVVIGGLIEQGAAGIKFQIEVPVGLDFVRAQAQALGHQVVPVPGVSEEAMAALINWRVNGMDQDMNYAPHECFGKTLSGLSNDFGPGQVLEKSVPEKHRPAAAAFHALSADEQYDVVVKELGYDSNDQSPY